MYIELAYEVEHLAHARNAEPVLQEERPADVDDQRTDGKGAATPVLDQAAEQVSADSSERTTQRDVPDHPFPFRDPYY